MFRMLASSYVSRAAAQRASRFIPNPLLRGALVAGATLLGPMLVRRFRARREAAAARQATSRRPSQRWTRRPAATTRPRASTA